MKNVTKTVSAPVVKPIVAPVVKTVAPKQRTLYYFGITPSMQGGLLRAYYMACALTFMGGKADVKALKAGVPFRVWACGNFATHKATKRIIAKGQWHTLTTDGVAYFKDEREQAEPKLIAEMVKAIRTGAKPASYRYGMVADTFAV